MRLLSFLVCFLGLRLAAQAQLSMSLAGPAEAEGSYVLQDNPQVRYTGRLKVSARQLVATDNTGRKTTWQPDEVASLKVGALRYTTAKGFTIHNGLWNHVEDKKVFVELLDSGRLSLLRYTTRIKSGQLGTAAQFTAYLVREGQSETVSTLYIDAGGNYTATYHELDVALRPYAADRPDLLKLLDSNKVSPLQLTRFVHALNTNSFF
ncbi:MAG: hypothetical protein ACRYFV_14685 [Janthinobacterium lividum]|jgi:hypothetical protein